jgi:hypothetical protein
MWRVKKCTAKLGTRGWSCWQVQREKAIAEAHKSDLGSINIILGLPLQRWADFYSERTLADRSRA